jgi:hypothetical protein
MDTLRRTRSSLTRITELLDEPCRAMRNLPSQAASNDDLRSKLDEFGSEWEYGIKKLGEFAGAGADALTTIERTFDELEEELVQAFPQ